MKLVVLGLSLSSSWGNGHATTYRALLREFARRGHEILFLERDVEWYRSNRDLPFPDFCRLKLYSDLDDLKIRFHHELRAADWVIIGSYVPEGVEVGKWATHITSNVAFYDIDTPVTLAKLARGDDEYISSELIKKYDVYLSFSGGVTLNKLEALGSPRARALYCSVDPDLYFPLPISKTMDLNYLGTYSDDRQPTLTELLIKPAKELSQMQFEVAGPQYPTSIEWPANVKRTNHLPPAKHNLFYNASRWTLNVTRADMIAAGWSPSVRLFEAAACGTPIISDFWDGLEEIFSFDEEIVVARSREEVVLVLRDWGETKRREVGEKARRRVLNEHTAAHRALELERILNGG